MSAVSKESEDEAEAAGTSSMMESSMMEGEEYYNPDTTVAWSEKVSGGEQLCRICAGPNEYLIPIFSGEGLEHQLGMKIEKHLPIQVLEHDKLPVQVCYQCASTLIAWHDLVVGCVEAEKKLRQLYQQQNVEEEEEEDDFGDDDRTELFADPVDSEMAEDPLEPSTSTSTATRSTRSPRKKSVTRAKPKLKMTLVKTPAALPKSPPKLLQPKEEQVEADPATERAQEPQLFADSDNHTKIHLEMLDNFLNQQYEPKIVTCNIMAKEENEENETHLQTEQDKRSANIFKTYPRSKINTQKKKKLSHIKWHALKKGSSKKIVHSSCTACGKEKIQKSELGQHIQFQCVLSRSFLSNLNDSTINLNVLKLSDVSIVDPLADLGTTSQIYMPSWDSLPVTSVDFTPPIDKASAKHTSVKTLYECKICCKKIRSKAVLNKHAILHEAQKCKICNTYLVSANQRKNHYKKHGERPKSRICPTCGKTFMSDSLLYKHKKKYHTELDHAIQRARSFMCEICGQGFFTRRILLGHQATHDSDRPRPFICEVCGKGFFNRGPLLQHQRSHSDVRPYVCTHCGTAFRRAESLKKHEVYMHFKKFDNIEAFTCSICDQQRLSKIDLSDHMNTHTGERPYACEVCDKTFRSRYTLRHHKGVHKAKTSPPAFPCNVCQTICQTASDLKAHKNAAHESRSLSFSCDKCDKKFHSQVGISMHFRLVHREKTDLANDSSNYKCNDCGTILLSKVKLLQHMASVHGNNSPTHSCKLCNKLYLTKTGLMHHIEAIHSDLTFSCKDCNKIFQSRASLRQHTKLVHLRTTYLTPFTCTICSKVSYGKNNYEMHSLIHQAKTIPCEVCGIMFRRKWDLQNHMRIHTGEKPYSCPICGLAFAQRSTRAKHIQNIHEAKQVS